MRLAHLRRITLTDQEVDIINVCLKVAHNVFVENKEYLAKAQKEVPPGVDLVDKTFTLHRELTRKKEEALIRREGGNKKYFEKYKQA